MAYPSARWFETGIVNVDGRDWLKLNVRTPAIDTEVRNILMGTSCDGRLLLVSVNMTKGLEDEWLETGRGDRRIIACQI